MGLEKRFDRAQSDRFSLYYGFTKRLRLAFRVSAWRLELGHYRSPKNPRWSKQWSERCGLQFKMTATSIQHIPCLSMMPAHWLRDPECRDNDPTSTTSG